MKKLTALLLSAILLLSLCLVCFAEELDPPAPEDLPEDYVNMYNPSSVLTISSSGNTTIRISCYGNSGTT